MLLLLSLRTIFHYLIRYLPDYYISEIFLSFLPYSMMGHYLAILLCLVLIIRKWRRLSKVHRLAHLCLYALIYISYLTTSTYLSTYTTEGRLGTLNSSLGTPLSFLYANILYSNKNMSGLLETIHDHNPDVIMLVEYADHQDKAIRKTLLQDYPYTSHYKPQSVKGYDGDIIYSRYPLRRIDTSTSPRAYNHVRISKDEKRYDIVLVHTAAPVSLHFWKLRKWQMNTLSDHLSDFIKRNRSNTISMFGDFNITPRVHDYKKFSTIMTDNGLHDATTNKVFLDPNTPRPFSLPQGAITTRGHSYLPFARAHIDHFWITKNIITQYRVIDIPGSDHDGFIGNLYQN